MRVAGSQRRQCSSKDTTTYLGSSTRFIHTDTTVLNSLEQSQLTHVLPARVGDHIAIALVRLQRWLGDRFARERYMHRATVLKVVAPSPAYAAAVVSHFSCLVHKKENTNIRRLLSEAENHQHHLCFLMELAKPNPAEICAIYTAQVLQFFVYLVLFTVAPRFAYRLLGYTYEESTVMYTHMINDIDAGKVAELSGHLPDSACRYWGIDVAADGLPLSPQGDPPAGWSLRHLALLIRADEMQHRDDHHSSANAYDELSAKYRNDRLAKRPVSSTQESP